MSTYVFVLTVEVDNEKQEDDTETNLRMTMESALQNAMPSLAEDGAKEFVITFEDIV